MKLNNKGFAISSIMYIILVLAVVLISLILVTLSSRKLILDKLREEVVTTIYEAPKVTYRQTIKQLKNEMITYMSNNSLENESVKVSDLNSSIDSDALEKYELSDKYLTAVQNENLYNVYLGKTSTISNTSELPKNTLDIIDYKIYGNSFQEGTPTPDVPIEIESVGNKTKNFLNKSNSQSGYINTMGEIISNTSYGLKVSEKIYVKPSTSYTYSGMGNISDTTVGITGYQYDKEGNPIVVISSSYGSDVTFTTDENCAYILLMYVTTVETPMLEEGIKSTNYEPYGYSIPIKVSGKNIFDKNNYTNIPYNINIGSAGSKLQNTNNRSIYIECKPNTTYTISKSVSTTMRVGTLVDIPETLVKLTTAKQGTGVPLTITSGENDKYLIIQLLVNDDYNNGYRREELVNYLQVEEGVEPSDYVPYVEPITTNIYVDEPLRKLNDYSDVVEFKNQQVLRQIEEIVFNGGELWQKSSQVDNRYLMYTNKPYRVASTLPKILCDRLIYNGKRNVGTIDLSYAGDSSSGTQLVLGMEFETLDDFTQYLEVQHALGTPMYINYILNESESFVTNLPKINMNNGSSVINIDTDILPSNYEFTVIEKIIEI